MNLKSCGPWSAFGLLLVAFTGAPVIASAQSAGPSPNPSPSASPTPIPGSFTLHVDAHTTFIGESTNGPGQSPAEGPGFAAGASLSPLSPYDTFSSAPLTPGNASESALYLRPSYVGKGAFNYSATLVAGYAGGSVTNAVYWGESLPPTLNPHLGAQHLPYAIVFPTHAGQDDGSAFTAGVLNGAIATKDGNAVLRAGWIDLTQSDAFVFTQPSIPNSLPGIGIVTPESLGDGTPNIDAWQQSSGTLPLHGIDFTGKQGRATVELTDAALPSLPGTSARMDQASVVIDHGEGTRYSAQLLHVDTGGDLVSTTVLYGGDPQLPMTPQGPLPQSTLGGQKETIFGARGAFHIVTGLDGLVEYGRSVYDAQHVAQPGTSTPGNYYHGGVTHPFGRAAVAVDYYRNEARYANAILPYGVPENVWSVAWSWPGQWLKSNYQLINNFPVNVNREGYRVKYTLGGGPLDVRVSYANFGQIDPISLTNASKTGFVDGFFLPQVDNQATLGRQRQYVVYLAWHPVFGDLTLDYAEDTMHRSAVPGAPQDTVSYDAPELVLSYARHVSKRLLASTGLARYGMRGSFGQGFTNIDFAQRTVFAGAEFAENDRLSTLVNVRRTAFGGVPTFLGAPSPNFTGSLIELEQRFKM